LVDLSKLFQKWLQLYAEQILTPPLEAKGPISADEICTILNTADYCLTTTTQLEERIKAKVDESLREHVQFDTPRESFISVANAALKHLVRKIETETDLSFREMVNTNWSTIDTVGDHSGYVFEMNRSIKDAISSISEHGHLRERYIRSLCDRVVEWFGTRFIDGIIASRPISEAGAEQMLLDVYVLKQGLLELPVLNSDPPAQAPAL
jgi:vacuolar protein sorting-associated protein 53